MLNLYAQLRCHSERAFEARLRYARNDNCFYHLTVQIFHFAILAEQFIKRTGFACLA